MEPPAWRGFGLSPPVFSEVAYAVALRARPDLRFAVASGGTATLPLVLALLAATPAALWAAASIGSALTGGGTVAASILPGLGSSAAATWEPPSDGGVAAMGFFRSPNPMFFASADRCAA